MTEAATKADLAATKADLLATTRRPEGGNRIDHVASDGKTWRYFDRRLRCDGTFALPVALFMAP
jgi:hypothetical protein